MQLRLVLLLDPLLMFDVFRILSLLEFGDFLVSCLTEVFVFSDYLLVFGFVCLEDLFVILFLLFATGFVRSEKFTKALLGLLQALTYRLLSLHKLSLVLHDLSVDLLRVLKPNFFMLNSNLELLLVIFSLLSEDLSLDLEALLRHISDGLRLSSFPAFVLVDHVSKRGLELIEHACPDRVCYEPDCALALLLIVLVAN